MKDTPPHTTRNLAIVCGLATSILSAQGMAAGFALIEQSVSGMGTAYAGASALGEDATTVYFNPAGMTRLERSELLVGIQPLYMTVAFSPDASTTTSGSDGDASTWLPAGGLYYVHNLRPKLKIGVSTVGYFGLGLEYENDWVGRYYVREVKLQALGVSVVVFDPCGNKPNDGDFISVMQQNIWNVQQAVQ